MKVNVHYDMFQVKLLSYTTCKMYDHFLIKFIERFLFINPNSFLHLPHPQLQGFQIYASPIFTFRQY